MFYIYFVKKKVIDLIRMIGVGFNEIIIEIEIESVLYQSVEWDPEDNKVYLHIFEGEELDIEVDFDELDPKSKRKVYNKLSLLIYN